MAWSPIILKLRQFILCLIHQRENVNNFFSTQSHVEYLNLNNSSKFRNKYIQLILIMLVGTDVCILLVFMWEDIFGYMPFEINLLYSTKVLTN